MDNKKLAEIALDQIKKIDCVEFRYDLTFDENEIFATIVDPRPTADSYLLSIDAAKPNSSDWTSLSCLDEIIATHSIVAAEPMVGDLVFYNDGKEYVRIKPNGKVFLGEGVSFDEASRLFWEQVEAVGMRLDSPESEENNVDSTSSPALDQVVNFMTRQSQDEQQFHNNNYERAMKVIK